MQLVKVRQGQLMRSHSENCSLSLDFRLFDERYGIALVNIFKWSFSLQDQWTLLTPPRAGCNGFAKDPNIKCCLSMPPFVLHRAPLEPYMLWPLQQNSCYNENFADHITLRSFGQPPNHVVLSVTFNCAVENWIWCTLWHHAGAECAHSLPQLPGEWHLERVESSPVVHTFSQKNTGHWGKIGDKFAGRSTSLISQASSNSFI